MISEITIMIIQWPLDAFETKVPSAVCNGYVAFHVQEEPVVPQVLYF